MEATFLENYNHIRSGGSGFYEQARGLIAVWGNEAVQFLDGLISNDVKTLADGSQMLAAFPNAKGRLLAVVRVLRDGDRFLFETEDATREAVFQNLFRFTYAGDFFVEDLSEQYRYFEIFGSEPFAVAGGLTYHSNNSTGMAVPINLLDEFHSEMGTMSAVAIDADVYETLRVENGIPKYGVDMDETTIVPEIGLEGMISYKKGCYIGQEIIARIHFRGHVAKQLTGLRSEPPAVTGGLNPGSELTTSDGKNAGRITSTTYSPKLDKTVALAYVRFDYLAEGTKLECGNFRVTITNLPFDI